MCIEHIYIYIYLSRILMCSIPLFSPFSRPRSTKDNLQLPPGLGQFYCLSRAAGLYLSALQWGSTTEDAVEMTHRIWLIDKKYYMCMM